MDQEAVEGLQKLIGNCDDQGKPLPEQWTMQKVDKCKKITG